ncbi:unnamed protein product [Bathycoccus prasinos]|jgi:hypothetical protein
MPDKEDQNLSNEQKRKKMLAHISQRVHASSPLPKNNSERKLQTKLDKLMHRLQDETVSETNLVDLLTEYALTLQEQAEQQKEEENGDVVEGLHAKACVAYEFASKWKERYTIYYNWAIAVGDRARVLESKRPEEARVLWREACEKYEKAVEVGMERSYLRGKEGFSGEMVTSMSVSRALNNHGLALRQRAMLMTDSETEESTESKSKCLSEAILKFRRAIRISPDFHRAAYNLGTVEFARGQMERAAVYVFSALAMVTSALPSSSETENAKVVYSQSAQLVETALPDTQCGDDSLFAGNVWFAGGVGGKREDAKNKRRTTITDFDWARRRFAVCASAFKTVDSAQTFRIKSESGDYVPSRNDAWGDDAATDTHFNVNLPMLSVESCEPISDISRPPNCFAFLLSIRDDLKDSEKENDDKDSPPAVVRHYRFACETESERDVWVDAIALLASLAKRGKSEHLKSCLLSLKTKRKKRVGFV